LGQLIVAETGKTGEQQVEQKMAQLISETSMGGNQDHTVLVRCEYIDQFRVHSTAI